MTKKEFEKAVRLMGKPIEISLCQAMSLATIVWDKCERCEFKENHKECDDCVAYGLADELKELVAKAMDEENAKDKKPVKSARKTAKAPKKKK